MVGRVHLVDIPLSVKRTLSKGEVFKNVKVTLYVEHPDHTGDLKVLSKQSFSIGLMPLKGGFFMTGQNQSQARKAFIQRRQKRALQALPAPIFKKKEKNMNNPNNTEHVPAVQNNDWRKWLGWAFGCGCATLLAIILCLVLVGALSYISTHGWVTVETTPAPVVSAPSAPSSPALATSCGTWNTAAKTTNWLVPGSTARGDVKANGVIYYDNGVGEGTSVINLSSKPVEIYAEWGSGCETSTDIKYLVNKDLMDGCGSQCKVARIVTITNSGITQKPYTEPVK